jgi:hypothetical protein
MPRVNHVKKCRKSHGKCGRCGAKIKKGFAYIWWKFNYGAKYIRCDQPCCRPKPSELTRSEFWGRIRDLQEEGFGGATFEDLKDRVTEVIDELTVLSEDCEEKFENMPSSLQEGTTGQLLQERADALKDVVSAIEAVDIPEEAPPDPPDDDRDTTEYDEANNIYLSRVDEVREELEQALADISCG